MKNQTTLFDTFNIPVQKNNEKYKKQKWRNKLQEYLDEQSLTTGSENGYCVCGYMSYCDYCLGAINKNACIKAISKMCNEKNIEIDYTDYDFEKFIDKVENNGK